MKYSLRNFLFLLIAALMLQSCSDDSIDEPVVADFDLVVYMVATNSLTYIAKDDIKEIQAGISDIPDNHNIIIYYASFDGTPELYKVLKDGTLKKLKEYDLSLSSVAPSRISDVLTDIKTFAPAKSYGLVLWSHATGWVSASLPSNPLSFGSDYGHSVNIDELADALPDNMFDFIWCDCCYMSGIEVLYQFRNKCRWFIASPTPLTGTGMPYNLTLRHLVPQLSELIEAAKVSYADIMSDTNPLGYTIAISDMTQIEQVAQAAAPIFRNVKNVSKEGLQTYTVDGIGPFYDFVQYAARVANEAEIPYRIQPLEEAVDNMVVFKLASSKFNNVVIQPDLFSGISVHIYSDRQNDAEDFYRSLDWYQNVFMSK